MSLYKQFKTNENLEKDGLTLDYGKNSKGQPIRIRIARAGGSNVKFLKTLDRKSKPYRRMIQNETLDEEVAAEIQREVYTDAVILGWEGVEDDAGVDMPFTRENCIKLLTDLPDLFADIRDQASKSALFRAEVMEGAAKN